LKCPRKILEMDGYTNNINDDWLTGKVRGPIREQWDRQNVHV
jgi:hypothetical protein